ncbi:hypothetical protein GGR14_003887 [Butyricimonas faecihominis]|uniref:Uncharacterized protein n=1 Tax=Butyricimonas faecihominis TaxID=1472416 RepID=A0A7W6I0Y6_9BACT|nr:hypothetical protein [Butyricimonas faecihominis]
MNISYLWNTIIFITNDNNFFLLKEMSRGITGKSNFPVILGDCIVRP